MTIVTRVRDQRDLGRRAVPRQMIRCQSMGRGGRRAVDSLDQLYSQARHAHEHIYTFIRIRL